MRRRTYGNYKLTPHIKRITSNTDWVVPPGCKKVQFFLVGGGGSGGGWPDWNWQGGGGGGGGQCFTTPILSLSEGQYCSIEIGAGGGSVAGGNSGNKGGTTRVIYNSANNYYDAVGGNGGLSGKYGASNETDSKATAGIGGGDNNGGINDAFAVTPIIADGVTITVYLKNKHIMNVTATNCMNPTVHKYGLPEFGEPGMPLHACGGTNYTHFKPVSDFTEGKGGDFSNTNENIYQHGGGGFGGGGAGQYFRSGTSGAGGNGCVVIRGWFTGNKTFPD